MGGRVLLIEDEPNIIEAIRFILSRDGWAVDTHADGQTALDAVARRRPDIIILDVMLPKMTGLEVCKLLRGEGSTLPIIMLTARGQEIDKVLGLKLGADDYVTKPFSPRELVARVRALLRRVDGGDPGSETIRAAEESSAAVGPRSLDRYCPERFRRRRPQVLRSPHERRAALQGNAST